MTEPLTTLPSAPEGFHWVPADHLPEVEKRVAKLARRANRLGLTPPSLETGETVTVLEKVEAEFQRFSEFNPPGPGEAGAGRSRYVEVEVSYTAARLVGETPRLGGWEFVATVQHVGDDEGFRNVLRVVESYEGSLPEEFRTSDPTRCDHCRKHLERRDTYVVHHEDGRWAQVGSTCLKDFLDHPDPVAYARYMALFLAEVEDLEDWEGGYGRVRREYDLPTDDFLAWTALEVRENGFVSKTKAAGREPSTADLVVERYFDRRPQTKPEDQDWRMAERVLEWVTNLTDAELREDYLWNLHVILTKPGLAMRETGYAASAVTAYKRAVQREAEKDLARQESEWQGEVGKRQDWDLTLYGERVIDGYYGTSILYLLRDADGNRFKWFSSSFGLTLDVVDEEGNVWGQVGVEEGQAIKLRATVKDHEEYEGVKFTVLTRGKLLEPTTVPYVGEEGA